MAEPLTVPALAPVSTARDLKTDQLLELFGVAAKALALVSVPVVAIRAVVSNADHDLWTEAAIMTFGAITYAIGAAMQAAGRREMVPGPLAEPVPAQTVDAGFYQRFKRCLSPINIKL